MPKKKKSEVQRIHDYKRVFGSAEGKRVLYDLMECGHMLTPSHTESSSHETAFREGERNMILRIMTILNTNVKALEEMIKQGEENYE